MSPIDQNTVNWALFAGVAGVGLLFGAVAVRLASHADQDDEAIRDIRDGDYALRLALGRELPGFSETFAEVRGDLWEGQVPREEWDEMVYPVALRDEVL